MATVSELDPPIRRSFGRFPSGNLGQRAIASFTNMQVVVLCPAGEQVWGGRHFRLRRGVHWGFSLLFGRVDNHRRLLYSGNYTDVIRVCRDQTSAADQTFLVSDGEGISRANLIRRQLSTKHCSPCLLPLMPSWLRAAGAVLGLGAVVDRLLVLLIFGSTKILRGLAWSPAISMDEGLRLTVDYYLLHMAKYELRS
jgi:hypothetical protein